MPSLYKHMKKLEKYYSLDLSLLHNPKCTSHQNLAMKPPQLDLNPRVLVVNKAMRDIALLYECALHSSKNKLVTNNDGHNCSRAFKNLGIECNLRAHWNCNVDCNTSAITLALPTEFSVELNIFIRCKKNHSSEFPELPL